MTAFQMNSASSGNNPASLNPIGGTGTWTFIGYPNASASTDRSLMTNIYQGSAGGSAMTPPIFVSAPAAGNYADPLWVTFSIK
jgi:hypothetical protein